MNLVVTDCLIELDEYRDTVTVGDVDLINLLWRDVVAVVVVDPHLVASNGGLKESEATRADERHGGIAISLVNIQGEGLAGRRCAGVVDISRNGSVVSSEVALGSRGIGGKTTLEGIARAIGKFGDRGRAQSSYLIPGQAGLRAHTVKDKGIRASNVDVTSLFDGEELVKCILGPIGDEDGLGLGVSKFELVNGRRVNSAEWSLFIIRWADEDRTVKTVHHLSLVVRVVEVATLLIGGPSIHVRVTSLNSVLRKTWHTVGPWCACLLDTVEVNASIDFEIVDDFEVNTLANLHSKSWARHGAIGEDSTTGASTRGVNTTPCQLDGERDTVRCS